MSAPILRALADAPRPPASAFFTELIGLCGVEVAAPRPEQPSVAAGVNVLSRREIEVLEMVARGLSNKEIARALFRSEATIATHLHNIYAKLEATGRMQAIMLARQRGLLV